MADPAYVPTLVWDDDSLVWDDRTLMWEAVPETMVIAGAMHYMQASNARDLRGQSSNARNLTVQKGMRK